MGNKRYGLFCICVAVYMYTEPLSTLLGKDTHLDSAREKENLATVAKITKKTQADTVIRKLATLKCQFVYLDLGSNKGVQIRKLFEPELYPGAAILPLFDKFFGGRNQRRKDVSPLPSNRTS